MFMLYSSRVEVILCFFVDSVIIKGGLHKRLIVTYRTVKTLKARQIKLDLARTPYSDNES